MADLSLDAQLASLRGELKEWEHAFAAANGGRKAERKDIKKDPSIAAKYKLYASLRTPGSSGPQEGKADDRDHAPSKKRKYSHEDELGEGYGDRIREDKHVLATPKKASKHAPTSSHFSTPLKQKHLQSQQQSDQLHPSQLDPYVSPSHFRNIFTPSQKNYSASPLPLRATIGPTPQRDGKALGLFDLLSASGGSTVTAATSSGRQRRALDAETPSKRNGTQRGHSNGVDDKGVPSTPSAQRNSAGALRARRYSLTPASSGKKFYLSRFFATPTVGRFATIPEKDEEGDAEEAKNEPKYTPKRESISGHGPGLETPSFLRRRNLFSSREANCGRSTMEKQSKSGFSPIPVRMPPRVMGKGLSALVQGLRDIEEEQEEDDLDALREMEAEEVDRDHPGENVLVEDSQLPIRPGPDGEERERAASPSKSRKPWKKIGQKRTTKLVAMRPNRAKPKPPPKWETIMEEEDSGGELDASAHRAITDTTAESQITSNELGDKQHDSDLSDNGNESNYDDDENDGDFAPNASILDAFSKSRKRMQEVAKKKRLDEAKKSPDMDAEAEVGESDKTKKPAGKPKKVNAQAHANYRALKIRSRGGGGGGAKFGGRFGRRR